jgi:ADP-heptose:LPS heptosyltransferase
MWMCEGQSYKYNGKYDITIKPDNYMGYDQEFIKLGESGVHRYNLVIHARNTGKCGTSYRNWDNEHWEEFLDKILAEFPWFSVACIGTKEGALRIRGINDERDLPLKDLCNLMTNSTVLVGPSSGPIHLGSLCGLPHVTWSPKETMSITPNKERYEKYWNPLKTPVTFLEGSWNPDVKDVVGAVRKYCED